MEVYESFDGFSVSINLSPQGSTGSSALQVLDCVTVSRLQKPSKNVHFHTKSKKYILSNSNTYVVRFNRTVCIHIYELRTFANLKRETWCTFQVVLVDNLDACKQADIKSNIMLGWAYVLDG